MRVNLYDVHVHIFALRDFLAGDHVAHVNYTVFAIVSVIVKEDVLRVVIGLVNEEEFGAAVLIIAGFPGGEVVLARI